MSTKRLGRQLLFAVVALASWRGIALAAERGPNILLVTLDTVRADRLGSYGWRSARTPVLDGIARRGVRWATAVAPSPTTLPSHSTLLTGLTPPRHGARLNGVFTLAEERTTLAEILAGHGWQTAAFVGSFVLDARFGTAQGFDVYDDEIDGTEAAGGFFPERPAGDVVARAIEWLDDRPTEKPFFLWLHFFDAHAPHETPGEVQALDVAAAYDAEIAYIDTQLGRVLETLSVAGAAPQTITLVTADHGESFLEHGETGHGVFIYDPTVRVPLLLEGPGIEPRVVTDRIAGLVDVVPTLLELAGVAPPTDLDGLDLLADEKRTGRALYLESLVPQLSHGWAPLFGMRTLEAKWIRAPESEYYDLVDDPGETNNLYPDGAGIADLERRLDRALTRPAAVAPRELTREEARKLEALGYLSGAATRHDSDADPKEMYPYLQRAYAAERRSRAGDLPGALAEIESVLRRDRNNARAWEVASLVYQRAGDLAKAALALERATALGPTVAVWIRLAQIKLALGQADAVEAILAEAEAADARNGMVWIVRGDRAALAGDFAAALTHFEKALEIDPRGVGPLARTKIRAAAQRLR